MIQEVLRLGQISSVEILMELHILVSLESNNHVFSDLSQWLESPGETFQVVLCVFFINEFRLKNIVSLSK